MIRFLLSLGAMLLLVLVASRHGFLAGGLTLAFAILTQIILASTPNAPSGP